MKTGETMTVMYLRHGRAVPPGARLVKMMGHHAHYCSIAILSDSAASPTIRKLGDDARGAGRRRASGGTRGTSKTEIPSSDSARGTP